MENDDEYEVKIEGEKVDDVYGNDNSTVATTLSNVQEWINITPLDNVYNSLDN